MFLLVGILWLWDAVFSYYHVQISLTFGHHIDMMQQGMFSPRFPFPAAVLVKNICIAWHHRLLLLDFLDLDSSIECALGLRILRRWVTWQSHFVFLVIYYTSINLWLTGDTKHTELSMKFNFPSKRIHVAVKKPFVKYISHKCIYRKKQNIRVYIYIHIPVTLAVLYFWEFNPPKEGPLQSKQQWSAWLLTTETNSPGMTILEGWDFVGFDGVEPMDEKPNNDNGSSSHDLLRCLEGSWLICGMFMCKENKWGEENGLIYQK